MKKIIILVGLLSMIMIVPALAIQNYSAELDQLLNGSISSAVSASYGVYNNSLIGIFGLILFVFVILMAYIATNEPLIVGMISLFGSLFIIGMQSLYPDVIILPIAMQPVIYLIAVLGLGLTFSRVIQ